MWLKITACTLFFIIAFYTVGVLGFLLFIIFLAIAELHLIFIVFLLIANLVWKLLTPDLRKTYENDKFDTEHS